MIRIAFAKVEKENLWELPVKNGMALGNQILHICGNMNQYVISSLGTKPDNRKRDMEFSAKDGYTIKQKNNIDVEIMLLLFQLLYYQH